MSTETNDTFSEINLHLTRLAFEYKDFHQTSNDRAVIMALMAAIGALMENILKQTDDLTKPTNINTVGVCSWLTDALNWASDYLDLPEAK